MPSKEEMDALNKRVEKSLAEAEEILEAIRIMKKATVEIMWAVHEHEQRN